MHRILIARQGSRPDRHWVKMEVDIFGINVMAMAWALCPRGVSLLVTAIKNSEPQDDMYCRSLNIILVKFLWRKLTHQRLCSFHECLHVVDDLSN